MRMEKPENTRKTQNKFDNLLMGLDFLFYSSCVLFIARVHMLPCWVVQQKMSCVLLVVPAGQAACIICSAYSL